MKKLIHFILTFCVLLGLAGTLWIGLKKQREKPDADEAPEAGAAPAEGEKAEEFVVLLDQEKWESLALAKAAPEKTELQPRRVAFGRVLDPTPLVTLDGDLASAEATLAASRAENERTQKLLAAGENTSRKVAETAEAQFRADEIRADGLRRRALLEWGALLPANDPVPRREFVEQLVRGEAALVRVDLLPGDALAESPRSARFVVLGREAQPVETAAITPAAAADPRTQAQGFVLRIDRPPFALRPGMALTAWLELPEKSRAGFSVPRSAILRHDGRAWVYVQEDGGKFTRKPVVLDTPLDAGWFIAEEGSSLQGGEQLVITGAQSLLSEELKAQGGGAD